MNWRISQPEHLLAASRIGLVQGGQFLKGRIAPNGPILRERNLSYVHKATWGMYLSGVEHGTIAKLLDWANAEARQPTGDFYFPEESPEYKDFQRLYRPLNFVKVAAWIGHPLGKDGQVIDRILQYYHEPSGGAFNYIGDDPAAPKPPETVGTLVTTFFGHLMLALDMREKAVAAGEWVRRWVGANREHMPRGVLYTQMTLDGELLTDVEPGQRISRVVDTQNPRQEFWNVGTAMAYLAYLYDVMRTQWGRGEDEARPYLDAALDLLDFETHMPLDTYLWPSKCKVAWGAGELLRVLVEHGCGDDGLLERAYRVAERVAMFTFLDNQLADGGWPWMHYPLSETIPEVELTYKPLKNRVAVPPTRIEDSQTIYLPREEITGEFLGELKAVEQGVAAWLNRA